MNFSIKTIAIIIMVFLFLTQCAQTAAQEPLENPNDIKAYSSYDIDKLLVSDIEKMLNSFELFTRGINSSNIAISKNNLYGMNKFYLDYEKDLYTLNDPGSNYQITEKNFENIYNTSWLIASKMEDNYYTYKVIKIYESRGDQDGYQASVTMLLDSVSDIENLIDYIHSNASVIKTRLSNGPFIDSHLNFGISNIQYYTKMINESVFNPLVGLEINYAAYNGDDNESLQQINNYLSSRGRPMPESLRRYYISPTYIPTKDLFLTIDCPDGNFTGGDKVTIKGTVLTMNGYPAANFKILALLEYLQPDMQTTSQLIVGSKITGADGSYRINFEFPVNISPGDCYLYTMFSPAPGAILAPVVSDKVLISVYSVSPSFTLSNMPLIYFKDDIIGVKGHLVLPNGYNASGLDIHTILPGTTFEPGITDDDGNFALSHVVVPGDSLGLKTITLWTPGNGGAFEENTMVMGTIVVLPFDKTVFSLSIVLVVLLTIVITIATTRIFGKYGGRTYGWFRKYNQVAVKQEGRQDFTEEINNIDALIQHSQYSEVIANAYQLSLRMAKECGIISSVIITNDEYISVVKQNCPEALSSFTKIIRLVEYMSNSVDEPVEQDAQNAVDSLKEFHKRLFPREREKL